MQRIKGAPPLAFYRDQKEDSRVHAVSLEMPSHLLRYVKSHVYHLFKVRGEHKPVDRPTIVLVLDHLLDLWFI